MEVFERNFDDVLVAIDICAFNATAYQGINIWVRIYQIQDVQHPPLDT